MTIQILNNSYGKSRVRLMKVARSGDFHQLQNLTLNIALEGDFEAIHTVGDNSACLPTDTMKNTVYALAGRNSEIENVELFGQRLAEHFLKNNPQVTRVRIELLEHGWERMGSDGQLHDHAFVRGSDEKRTANINATRDRVTIRAGVQDLVVIKTARSGFAGFIRDEFTTLPETSDRILSTAIKSDWLYSDQAECSNELFENIRQTILETFAGHDSLSVQHTLYAMGEAVLAKFSEVDELAFSLPNIHCLPVDLTRFGMEDENRIFVPTDEPHGLIEARLTR